MRLFYICPNELAYNAKRSCPGAILPLPVYGIRCGDAVFLLAQQEDMLADRLSGGGRVLCA